MRSATRVVHTGFLWGSLGERENFEDLDVNGMIILKWNLKKSVAKAWAVLIWLRIRTSGWLL
jgi:hypothetical protein